MSTPTHASPIRLHRLALAGLVVWLGSSSAASAAEILAAEVKPAGLGTFVDGDDARFQERHQVRSGGQGGVESAYIEADLDNGRTLKFEGRALLDNHDYLARLLLTEEDRGYIDAGYQEGRQWYDGSGGFFPPTGAYYLPFDDELSIDRSNAWLEAGLRVPEWPEVTARYDHRERDGKKGSLAWGPTTNTGGRGARAIVPAYFDIDEKRDTVAVDVSHKIRRTKVGAGFRYESSDLNNGRNMAFQPGETGSERYATHDEGVDSELINVRAFTENLLTRQKTMVTSAYSFTQLDNDLTGSRIYGAGYDPIFEPNYANRQRYDLGFLGMTGSSDIVEHIGMLNALYLPRRDLRIRLGTRVERQDIDADSQQTETLVQAAGVLPFLSTRETPLAADTTTGTTSVSESLDVRYTGVRQLVLFTRADWEQRRGDIAETLLSSNLNRPAFARQTDVEGVDQRYAVGAQWYPLRRFSLLTKTYYERRDSDYDHGTDSTDNQPGSPDRYSAYIRNTDIARYGAQSRLTYLLPAGIRLSGTYDYLRSTIDVRKDQLDDIEAAHLRSHAFGLSSSWTPGPAYMQGVGSYVMNETDTRSDDLDGVPGEVVRIVPNDYWSAQFIAGLVVDERTDVEALYSFYFTDNYENNAEYSQPYGSKVTEHGVTVGARRKLTETVDAQIRYGYFTSDDDETGGYDDYDGHLVYGAIRYAF